MDDRDVIDAFVASGARKAFGPQVHVEGDALFLQGWWQTAFRVAPGVFLLRNEEAPDGSTVLEQVAAALSASGLRLVGVDMPAMMPIVYTELTLGDASWTLWASDLVAGESALTTRVTTESFVDTPSFEPLELRDLGAELGGARRLAGVAPSVILTVGLDSDVVRQLGAGLSECRLIARAFGEIVPDRCGSLIPTMIVVDTSNEIGRAFIEGLRADPFCRFLPIAAVSPDPRLPSGADVALDPKEPAAEWVEPLRRILP